MPARRTRERLETLHLQTDHSQTLCDDRILIHTLQQPRPRRQTPLGPCSFPISLPYFLPTEDQPSELPKPATEDALHLGRGPATCPHQQTPARQHEAPQPPACLSVLAKGKGWWLVAAPQLSRLGNKQPWFSLGALCFTSTQANAPSSEAFDCKARLG